MSGNDEALSGSGSGGVFANLLTDDGLLNWSRVAEVFAGTVIGAFFSGLASVVLGIFDIPIALAGGLADFFGRLVRVLVGLPSILIDRGFAAAIPFVVESGPAGYVVALGITLLTVYVMAQVVSRVW